MLTVSELQDKRGYFCECGCGQQNHDRHHCLIPQINKKGKTKWAILDEEENLVLVNHWEHTDLRKFDNLEWRRYFWKRQCDRYGKEHMQAWVASLPSKLRHRLDFME